MHLHAPGGLPVGCVTILSKSVWKRVLFVLLASQSLYGTALQVLRVLQTSESRFEHPAACAENQKKPHSKRVENRYATLSKLFKAFRTWKPSGLVDLLFRQLQQLRSRSCSRSSNTRGNTRRTNGTTAAGERHAQAPAAPWTRGRQMLELRQAQTIPTIGPEEGPGVDDPSILQSVMPHQVADGEAGADAGAGAGADNGANENPGAGADGVRNAPKRHMLTYSPAGCTLTGPMYLTWKQLLNIRHGSASSSGWSRLQAALRQLVCGTRAHLNRGG